MNKACFKPSNILLPSQDIDLQKWAVIACDQYTSQPEYWLHVEEFIGNSASAYRTIYPEAYLQEKTGRIQSIHTYMKNYLEEGVLTEVIHNGFVLTVRQVSGGIRVGLIGMLDLEQYEFREKCPAAVRATEGTILFRIPPRVNIRKDACIELPHVMVLLNDPKNQVIETLYEERSHLRKLYDFDLMMQGGHIAGYAVEGEVAVQTSERIVELQNETNGAVMAVGDGNHSLAAAKEYWKELKKELSDEEQELHPGRYALVEVVNLYNDAIVFGPIHRVLFNTKLEMVLEAFDKFLAGRHIKTDPGTDIVFSSSNSCKSLGLSRSDKHFTVGILQEFLDEYVKYNKNVDIDYIHGEEAVNLLVKQRKDVVGILLKGMEKMQLFSVIESGDVLPRKSFSMGEADDKRFYLECRKLVE